MESALHGLAFAAAVAGAIVIILFFLGPRE